MMVEPPERDPSLDRIGDREVQSGLADTAAHGHQKRLGVRKRPGQSLVRRQSVWVGRLAEARDHQPVMELVAPTDRGDDVGFALAKARKDVLEHQDVIGGSIVRTLVPQLALGRLGEQGVAGFVDDRQGRVVKGRGKSNVVAGHEVLIHHGRGQGDDTIISASWRPVRRGSRHTQPACCMPSFGRGG